MECGAPARAYRKPTPALLTLDGRRVEIGGHDRDRMSNTRLGGLPGDTVVVRVLYHA